MPELGFIEEPLIEFMSGQFEQHPKDGLFLYGPIENEARRKQLRYGVIGTKTGQALLDEWIIKLRGFIPAGKEGYAHHSSFPGFEAAFGVSLSTKPIAALTLNAEKLSATIRGHNRHEAIKATVDLYANTITDHLENDADVAPDIWFVVIPDEVQKYGRPQSAPPTALRTESKSKLRPKAAKRLLIEPSLFPEDNKEAELQRYKLHFHNQLKAKLLGKAVIQGVKEGTLFQSVKSEAEVKRRTVQDPASLAWNFSTTSYYKTSGPPWRLANMRQGVCYVGIVFTRDDTQPDRGNACCGAQLFLQSGEGLVFKGAIGRFWSEDLKQFHLTGDKAKTLMEMVVEGYKNTHGNYPDEIFIHGSARFNKAEWDGFREGVPEKTDLVAISIRNASDLKLYRLAKRSPLRGTYMKVNDRFGYLWASGYVPRLNTYPGWEIPNPKSISIDWGDAELKSVLQDVLALTKVNFNSCEFGGSEPITLRFARHIGEILTAIPEVSSKPQPFKYYI